MQNQQLASSMLSRSPLEGAELGRIAELLEEIAALLRQNLIKAKGPLYPGSSDDPFPNQVFDADIGVRQDVGSPWDTFVRGLGRS